MNLTINPKYQSLKTFMLSLPERFDSEGVVLRDKRNVVKSFEVDGQILVVKRYKVSMLHQRIDYTLFRPSKAKRAYKFALRLREMGIDTPEPVAFIETTNIGLFRQGYFVSAFTSDNDIKSHLTMLDDKLFFSQFVDFIVFMHTNGFLHGDTNLSNFLYRMDGKNFHFQVIDINRSHFKERPSQSQCLENFKRMTHDRILCRKIVSEYARRRGWDPVASADHVIRLLDQFERKRKAHDYYKRHFRK